MKDYDGIILLVVGCLVALVLYLGFRNIIGRLFKASNSVEQVGSESIKRTQQQRMDDIKQSHRRLMEERQQRLRDAQQY